MTCLYCLTGINNSPKPFHNRPRSAFTEITPLRNWSFPFALISSSDLVLDNNSTFPNYAEFSELAIWVVLKTSTGTARQHVRWAVPVDEAVSRLTRLVLVPAHPAAVLLQLRQPPQKLTLGKASMQNPPLPPPENRSPKDLIENSSRLCSYDCCTKNGFQNQVLEML